MPSPVTYPRWSTNAATTTTPSSGTQDTGFIPGSAASGKIVNWLLNLIYKWIVWFDGQDQANTTKHGVYDTHFTTHDTQILQARSSRDYAMFTQPRATVSPSFSPLAIASGGTLTGPLHVVVGASGNWIVSKDKGQSWNAAATAGSANFLACAFHAVNSSFVAAGASGTLYESNNTVSSWTARTPAGGFSGTFYDALWFNATSTMLLCCSNGSIQYGTSMTSLSSFSVAGTTDLRQFATDDTTVIAVGAATGDGRILKSTNGSSWTLAADITGAGTLLCAAWHAGLGSWFVASATDLYYSSNLTSWTHVSLVLDSSHTYAGLVALSQGLVAFHYNGSTLTGCCAKFTPDGTNWFHTVGFGPHGGLARPRKVYATNKYASADVPKHYALWAGSLTGSNFVTSAWYAPDGLL